MGTRAWDLYNWGAKNGRPALRRIRSSSSDLYRWKGKLFDGDYNHFSCSVPTEEILVLPKKADLHWTKLGIVSDVRFLNSMISIVTLKLWRMRLRRYAHQPSINFWPYFWRKNREQINLIKNIVEYLRKTNMRKFCHSCWNGECSPKKAGRKICRRRKRNCRVQCLEFKEVGEQKTNKTRPWMRP